MIATLATRADEAGIRTCVVSTDRDAFQLCSENVSLMMTRGVADVHVYTPDRVELRYGDPARPGARLHRAWAIPPTTSRGSLGSGQDGRAAHLAVRLARGGHRPRRRPVAGPRQGGAGACRPGPGLEGPGDDASRPSARRRPVRALLAPPDRSTLKEIFRRFEFRALLGRVDTLDEALPAADIEMESEAVSWREGAAEELVLNQHKGLLGVAFADGRLAAATSHGVVVSEVVRRDRPAWASSDVATHDAKRLRLGHAPADDTLIAAYLVDPGRAGYEIDGSRASTGSSSSWSRRRKRRPPRSCSGPRPPGGSRHGCGPDCGSGGRAALRRGRAAARRRSSRTWRTPASRSTRTAWGRSPRLAERVEELEATAIALAGRSSSSGRHSSSPGSSSRSSGSRPAVRARQASPPTRACCA